MIDDLSNENLSLKRSGLCITNQNPFPHNMTIPNAYNSIKDGKGDNKFVITVAPQKLICPKGKT